MEAPGNQTGPKSEINITPLVDVVLVLLIIFIVVTPMLTRGADVLVPAADNADQKEDSSEDVIVSVQRTGEVWLGSELVTSEILETRLTNIIVSEPFKPILIKGDFAARYADVRKVMAICERAEAKNVALMTDKDSTVSELREQLKEMGIE